MANFAYLRVSTDRQDVENQKLGVIEYCNLRGISPLKITGDTAKSKIPWKERGIGQLLEEAKKGDTIVVSEISRLGRSALQVLEILELSMKKEISVHTAKIIW